MRDKKSLFTKLILGLVFTTFLPISQAIEVRRNITIDMGSQNERGTWIIPNGTPKALVYLQHRFFGNASDIEDMGTYMAENGFLVLSISANMAGGNPRLAEQVATALSNNNISGPDGGELPNQRIFAGHSAGGLHATVLAAKLIEKGDNRVSGLIMLDSVDANNLALPAITTLIDASVNIGGIFSRGGACNSNNNMISNLSGLYGAGITGVKLTNRSTHLDPEGSNSGWLIRLICGTPRANNIDYYWRLSEAWASEFSNASPLQPSQSILTEITTAGNGEALQ